MSYVLECDDYRKKYQFRAEEFIDEEAAPNEFPFMVKSTFHPHNNNSKKEFEYFILGDN